MERSMSSCGPSTGNVSYSELENRVPEIMTVLKKDKALSDMILDMINNDQSSN